MKLVIPKVFQSTVVKRYKLGLRKAFNHKIFRRTNCQLTVAEGVTPIDYTIVLKEGEQYYKITKIVFLKDGGFSILVPYHKSHEGWLIEWVAEPELYYACTAKLPFSNGTHYTAADRVKLSYHADGFVQFSSERTGKIISGRDSVTGEPKGLGLFTQPLSRPIETGPSFTITIWGIKDFELFTKRKKGTEIIKFGEDNYYYRRGSELDWNGYGIEGFVMKAEDWKYVRKNHDRYTFTAISNYFEVPGTIFTLEVLPQKQKDYFLALLVTRVKTKMGNTPSGFLLSSPTEFIPPGRFPPSKVKSLVAIYPLPQLSNVEFKGTLDY